MNGIEYGFKTALEDEQTLVRNINTFLDSLNYRKMQKKKPTGIRNIDDPASDPQLDYVHTQFMKQSPQWLLELAPNVDKRGIARFPQDTGSAWTMFFTKMHPELNSEEDDASLDDFLNDLLSASGFEFSILHEYTTDDYRR